MRKSYVLIGAGALLWLAACQPADPVKADIASCETLLTGDTEIEEDLAEYGSSVASYCDCYARTLAGESEGTQTGVRKVVDAISSIRTSEGVALENAAERVEEFAEGRAQSEVYDISSNDFEAAGRIIEGVRRQLRDADGQCAAPEV